MKKSVDIQESARFRLSIGQVILGIAMVGVLILFSTSTLKASQDSIKQAEVLTNAETPASSIIFTQRETLVYVTRFSEWLSGNITRRELQIARALLAQRMSVIDGEGSTIASRIDPQFISALKKSDLIVSSGPAGYLPESLHKEFLKKSGGVIDEMVTNARSLVVSYQQAVDAQLKEQARNRERIDRLNLAYLMLLIVLTSLFIIWLGITTRAQYRRARRIIATESAELQLSQQKLLDTQSSLEKLQTLNQAKNEFISTVNHELRTPLTSIIGYIDIIRKRMKNGGQASDVIPLVDSLDRNAVALMDMVESMLSISQLDRENPHIVFNKLDLYEIAQEVIFILQPAISDKSISVNISGKKDEFVIDGSHGEIAQVFMNLLSNAIKFSPANSEIELQFSRKVSAENIPEVDIRVQDYGMGIAPTDIPELFTRFFRGQNAVQEQIPGTGLGLAIVEKIIHLHGGVITVESTLGAGTKFEVRFPEAISKTDQLINERRLPVLERAIVRISQSLPEELASAAHEVGGAIGFYSYLEEGEVISRLSRELEENPSISYEGRNEIKEEILQLLHLALTKTTATQERAGSH